MAFLTPTSAASGDFIPVLAYKANSGRLYTRDRAQNVSGDWEAVETEITQSQPAFAVDFGSLQVGWCHFVRGMAPQWAMVPYGQPLPPMPPSPGNDERGKALNYRQGFKVMVAGNAIGGLRELAGNSAALITGMNELHTAYEAAPEAARGQIPVVKLINTLPIRSGQATNFQPVFQVQGWVDRVAVFGPRLVPPPSHAVSRPAAVAPTPTITPPVTPTITSAAPTTPVMADSMPF